MAIALVWYALGGVLAGCLGALGIVFEVSAYVVWGASDRAKSEEKWNWSAIESLVRVRDSELMIDVGPGVTQIVSLDGVESVSLGDVEEGHIGLMLKRSTGNSEQVYVQTRHAERELMPALISGYLKKAVASDT